MKIAMIVENHRTQSVSGGRVHALFMACALVELNHDVILVTQNKPLFFDEFAKHYQMPKVKLTPDLIRVIGQFNHIDLVIGYPIIWSAVALEVAKLLGVPCWNIILDCETICKTYAPAVASRMHYGPKHTQALTESDLLLSISDFAVPYIIEWTGNRNTISLMGCVNSRLANTILGGRSDRFVAITRCTRHKRLSDLVFVAKRTGVNIDIITSHSPDQVARRVSGVSDRVWVHANLSDSDKFEMIKSVRALICPSAYEGLGIPAMEAMYCGAPVICYDFPILREVCGKGALYASYCSPESLANQVKKIMKDDNLRQNLAARAFRKGRDYSFEMLCKRLRGVLAKWAM